MDDISSKQPELSILWSSRTKKELEGLYVGTVGARETKLISQIPRTRIEYAEPGYLVFVREGSLVAQSFDIKRLSLSGEPRVLVEHIPYFDQTGFAEFSISETGILVYQVETALSKLAWFDRTGRELGKIGNADHFQTVRLSPDSKEIAVTIGDPQTSSGDIWIYDLSGGRNRFAFGPRDESGPVWSPDKRRLAYFGQTSASKSSLLIKDVQDVNRNGESPFEEGFIFPDDWSRDGRYLIYSVNDPTVHRDIWVLPLEGERKPFPFLKTQASESIVKFSPDGRFVAFVSDESGTTEVYVSRFDKPNEKIRVSSGGGTEPHWRRDGRVKELILHTTASLSVLNLG